jgi:hypothetical protein
VRAFHEFGVNSFDALLAPFLVDSTALQQRVLESPLAERMLAGVRRIKLVGVALVPGELRRPLGITRRLVGPRDFRGARIGVRPADIAAATFRALGATSVPYLEGSLAGLDGAELDVWTIGGNKYDQHANALTANVAFWPRTQAVVMNRSAFEALTPQQRQVLLEAGRATVSSARARLVQLRREGLTGICRRAKTALVTAPNIDLVALRKAVQPVYEQLERDPATKRLIASIAALPDPESSPPTCPVRQRRKVMSTAAPDGRWKWTWSRAELLQAGVAGEDAAKLSGTDSVEFKDGRFHTGSGYAGTYQVDGDTITFVFGRGGAPGVSSGYPYELRWSVYRGQLAFKRIPGRPALLPLLIRPFTRAR